MQIEQFKAAVGKYPTGVTVISTTYKDKLFGFTANSFTSVSLEPTLISFCLDKRAGSFEAFFHSRNFVINILSGGQQEIAARFASHIIDKFQNVQYSYNDLGIPVIDNSLSVIECEKYDQIECGDHYIFIGKALKATINSNQEGSPPLVYYKKSYYGEIK